MVFQIWRNVFETKSTSVCKTICNCEPHKCVLIFSETVPLTYAQVLASHKNSLEHTRRNAESQVFEIRVIKLGSAVHTALENVYLNWDTILGPAEHQRVPCRRNQNCHGPGVCHGKFHNSPAPNGRLGESN